LQNEEKANDCQRLALIVTAGMGMGEERKPGRLACYVCASDRGFFPSGLRPVQSWALQRRRAEMDAEEVTVRTTAIIINPHDGVVAKKPAAVQQYSCHSASAYPPW